MENNLRNNGKIGILLPVYNDEKYLGFCLESIKNQTYGNFICLVGFNGTTDNSKSIFKSTVGEDDRFFYFDYGSEKGKCVTLNKLLNETSCEHLCVMDGDDIWDHRKLEKQILLLGRYDIIGSLCNYINENNNLTTHIRLPEFDSDIKKDIESIRNPIINSSSMFKRKDIVEIGGWSLELEGIEDFDLWIRLSRRGKTFYNIQEPLVYHRIHSGSSFNSDVNQGTVLKRNLISSHF
jgi:glycosyltransferase involved in cell wall biosynthesis